MQSTLYVEWDNIIKLKLYIFQYKQGSLYHVFAPLAPLLLILIYHFLLKKLITIINRGEKFDPKLHSFKVKKKTYY